MEILARWGGEVPIGAKISYVKANPNKIIRKIYNEEPMSVYLSPSYNTLVALLDEKYLAIVDISDLSSPKPYYNELLRIGKLDDVFVSYDDKTVAFSVRQDIIIDESGDIIISFTDYLKVGLIRLSPANRKIIRLGETREVSSLAGSGVYITPDNNFLLIYYGSTIETRSIGEDIVQLSELSLPSDNISNFAFFIGDRVVPIDYTVEVEPEYYSENERRFERVSVVIIDITSPEDPRVLSTIEGVYRLQFSDNNIVVTAHYDGSNYYIKIYDVSDPSSPLIVNYLGPFSANEFKFALSRDGKYLAYYYRKKSAILEIVDISDPREPKTIANIVNPPNPIDDLAFSSDSNILATLVGGDLYLWKPENLKLIGGIPGVSKRDLIDVRFNDSIVYRMYI